MVDAVDLCDEWRQCAEANGHICFHEAWLYHRGWIEASVDAVQPLVRQRILSGSRLADAEYRRLLEERRRAIEHFNARMAPYAALLTPTVGQVAPMLSQADPADVELAAFTRPVNYLDACAISLPAGRSAEGLPLAVQLTARGQGDAALLALARQLEGLALDAPGEPR